MGTNEASLLRLFSIIGRAATTTGSGLNLAVDKAKMCVCALSETNLSTPHFSPKYHMRHEGKFPSLPYSTTTTTTTTQCTVQLGTKVPLLVPFQAEESSRVGNNG